MPYRSYYLKHKERLKAAHAEWRKHNSDRIALYNLQYRKRNPPSQLESRRLWHERNKYRIRIYRHNRRARLRGQGNLSPLDWQRIKALYNYTCPECLQTEPDITLSVDHMIPISKGGEHIPSNIQPLCLLCNMRKQDKAWCGWFPYLDRSSLFTIVASGDIRE